MASIAKVHPLRCLSSSRPSVFHHTELVYLRARLQDIDGFTLYLFQDGLINQAVLEEVEAQNRQRGASNAALCLLIRLCQSGNVSLREKFDAILRSTQPDVFEGLQELITKAEAEIRSSGATHLTADDSASSVANREGKSVAGERAVML